LPIVIPPVVLIIGVLQVSPGSLKSTPWLLGLVYVILSMPFAYRSIDAGLRALDLKTLTEASNSLGAGWLTTLWRVILPNIRTALLSATVADSSALGARRVHHGEALTFYVTFPGVDRPVRPAERADVGGASLLALFVTWLLLMAITTIATAQNRRKGGGEVTLFSAATTTQTIGES